MRIYLYNDVATDSLVRLCVRTGSVIPKREVFKTVTMVGYNHHLKDKDLQI